jgi:hypothetical protein
MSRKDYVALAEAFRSVKTEPWTTAEDTWNDCLKVVAKVLAADNPRFDREKFEAAARRS